MDERWQPYKEDSVVGKMGKDKGPKGGSCRILRRFSRPLMVMDACKGLAWIRDKDSVEDGQDDDAVDTCLALGTTRYLEVNTVVMQA